MRVLLITLLFLCIAVLCIEGQKCGTKKKCTKSKGACQSKKMICDGTVLGKGKKYCKNKKCLCCKPNKVKPVKPLPCKLHCFNGGTCQRATNGKQSCACLPGYLGKSCRIPECVPPCGIHGKCTAPGVCTCAPGWTGPTCEIPICDVPCENGGVCSAPNVCTCTGPWGGPLCNLVSNVACSKELIMESGVPTTWDSPGYDGVTHYPDGDYCCWLNVTIPDTYTMFMATMTMSNPARIYESSSCSGDRIYYYPSSGNPSQLCGNLAGQLWSETAVQTTPQSFSFEWCSVSTDGGTDVGFSMTISGNSFDS